MDFEGFEALLAAADMVLKGEMEPDPSYAFSCSDTSTLTASSYQPWYADSSGMTENDDFVSDCTTLTAASEQMRMESSCRNKTLSESLVETKQEPRKRRNLFDTSACSEASSIERTRAGVLISSNGQDLRNISISSGSSTMKRTRGGVMLSNVSSSYRKDPRSSVSLRSSEGQRLAGSRTMISAGSKSQDSSFAIKSQRSLVDLTGAGFTSRDDSQIQGTSIVKESQRSSIDKRLKVSKSLAGTGSTSRGDSHLRGISSVKESQRSFVDKQPRVARDDSRIQGTSSAEESQRSFMDNRLEVANSLAGVGSTTRGDSQLRGISLAEESQRSFVDLQLEMIKSSVAALPRHSFVDQRRDVGNSTPIRKQSHPIAEMSFGNISIIRNDEDDFALEDMYERFNSTTILFEESDGDDEDEVAEKPGDLGFDDTAPECVQAKQPSLRARNHDARVHGKEYKRSDGTFVPARSIKPACSCTFLKCNENFDQISRERILKRFLELNLSGQNQLLASHIDVDVTVNPQVVNSRRLFTRQYYLPSNGGRIQVCKLMFQATFDIGDKTTRVIAKKKLEGLGIAADDLRKNNTCHKIIPEEHVNFIKSHIRSFPAYKSHYSSEKSEKLYLSSDLNIAKMYNLYLKKCTKPHLEAVHYNSYRLIFKQFKLSFRKPKLDTCPTCDKFTIRLKLSESETETADIQREREVHQGRASAAYTEKRNDVTVARNSSEIRTASFDLQKCLATPYLQCGTAFYSRQLWTLNLTIFSTCDGTNEAHCYMWDESLAKRGSQEISSCLLLDLTNMNEEIKQVTYYSDRCGGQNLNYVVCSTFLHFIQQCHSQGRELIIRHKFMTSGHSHMECDSIHASIEKAKKKCSTSIETPREWAIFIGAISRKVPLNVIQMRQEQFLALKELKEVYKRPKKDLTGDKLCFKDICFFEYRSVSPGMVFFKYAFDEDQYRCFRMAPEGSFMCTPGPIATEPLPLPAEKLEDLQKLLPFVTNKAYYETLLKNIVPKKRGRKPQNNVIDEFDGDLDDSVLFEYENEDDE